MAGTWMSVVEGFGGMRVRDHQLRFNPILPARWASFAFQVGFRGALLQVTVNKAGVQLVNQSDLAITVAVYDRPYRIEARSRILAPAG
jgi:maltose phosphorylase